jgi:hypothetical protein
MNTDVLRGIESQDLCVLICGLCFRLEFAFGGQRAAGSGWAEFFNHGWTQMNTDFFAMD